MLHVIFCFFFLRFFYIDVFFFSSIFHCVLLYLYSVLFCSVCYVYTDGTRFVRSLFLSLSLGRQVADQRSAGLNRVHKEVENAQIEAACHSMLLDVETKAIPQRVADAEAAAAAEAEAEELLQVRDKRQR